MARNRFRGDAQAVAQVSRFQVTAVGAVGDTVTVTINRKTVVYTLVAGDTTATILAASIAAALAASDIAEFLEEVWTSATTYVYATAANPGFPFTITSAAASGTTTVGAVGTTVTSAGPHHWGTAANWSLNAVPVNTNDVDLQDCNVDILFDLDQSAVTLASLNIDSTFTGKLGLPPQNGSYYEYRDTYLKVGATTVTIGAGSGGGSSLVRIDLGAVASTILVIGTATGGLQGQPAVFLKGTNAANVLTVLSGFVGPAFDIGAVFACAVMACGGSPAGGGGGIGPGIIAGAGCTWATRLDVQGGTFDLMPGNSAVTIAVVNQDGGTITLDGAVNVTALNGRGGIVYYDATGTITAAVLSGTRLDCSRDPRAKTITNMTVNAGSGFIDPAKHVTLTNPASFPDGLDKVDVSMGKQILIQRS